MSELETNIELPLTIDYVIHEGEPRSYDFPGYDAEVEIISISLFDKEFTPVQVEMFIAEFGKDNLDTLCFEHARTIYDNY
jgi:hypothetical protein